MNSTNLHSPNYSVSFSVLIAETVYKLVSGAERLLQRFAR